MVGRICIAIDSLALLGLFGGRRRGRIALEELLARNAFFSGIAFVTSISSHSDYVLSFIKSTSHQVLKNLHRIQFRCIMSRRQTLIILLDFE